MNEDVSQLGMVAAVFLLAGAVKGVAGMGLPTVAMGLLGLWLPPSQAAALLVLPSLVTNLQQAWGPAATLLLRRLWPVLAMVALIKQTHPDVFGTQELVSEQAAFLAEQLPDYRWFGQGRRGDDSDEHMGVFYDARVLEVVESGDFWLSDTPERAGSITWGNVLPRMATWALFERRSDKRRFYLFNTHFPYRDEDEPARERSARLILSRIAQLPATIPVVLTGDFNSDPDKITYPTLTAVLRDARAQASKRSGPENTFQDFTTHPTRRIDWILYRGLRPSRFATLDDRPGGILPSDHYPVMAEFEWPR